MNYYDKLYTNNNQLCDSHYGSIGRNRWLPSINNNLSLNYCKDWLQAMNKTLVANDLMCFNSKIEENLMTIVHR